MAEPEAEKEVSREDLYQQYQQQQGGAPPVEEKEAEEPPKEAEPAEEKEEPKEEVKEPPKEKKQVPYEALHEERLKRQASDKAKKDAEERARDLESEIARLRTNEEPTEETISDYDREIIELRRRVQAQENIEKQRQEREKTEAAEKAQEAFNKTLSDIDKELRDEGYAGFKYVKESVFDELNRMVQEDESNRAYDTKEGIKRIYREKFFNEAAREFTEALQKREKLNKEELKKQADIGTPPNKAPLKAPSPENMTPEERQAEYMRMRRGE